jgi:hypothetical protein
MSTHVNKLLGNRFFLALSLVFTMMLVSLAVVTPPKTGACPSNQIEYTYYTDASMTVACGSKIITCYCRSYSAGCQTAYYTIDWSEC